MSRNEFVPVRLFPPVATRAILAGIGVYWAMSLIAGGPADMAVLVAFGGNFRPLVWAGEWWRLVVSMFLHAGWLHLLLNGYALFVLGRNVEAFYGPWKLLALFLGSGIAGSFASALLWNPLSVGASGGIFGLLGASLVFAFRWRSMLEKRVTWVMGTALLPWVVLNLVIGVVFPYIDMAAHVGGLAGGALLALVFSPDALDEARTGMVPAPPRLIASLSLALLVVSFAAAGVNIVRTRGPDGPVLPPDLRVALLEANFRHRYEDFEDRLGSSPGDPETLLMRVRYHIQVENWEAAIRDCRTLLEKDPDDARALNTLAWILLEEAPPPLRDREEAERLARRAVERQPDDSYSVGTLATARLRAGDLSEAAELFARALDLDSYLSIRDESTGRYLYAIVLQRLGRAEEAQSMYRRAVRLNDADPYRSEAEAALQIQKTPSS
ncbi:MAG: rhomboid family intramembrane serine protease [bacterium]